MGTIHLKSQPVQYTVERKKRRTIGMRIRPNSVIEVSAPYLTPNFIIEQFIKEKSDWILRHIQRQQQVRETGEMIQYTQGSLLPFFTESYILQVTPHATIQRARVYVVNKTFQVFLPQKLEKHTAEVEVRDAIHDWYLKNTKPILSLRVEKYAQQMGISYGKISVKDVSSHWGSCSSNGSLNFNYRIAMLPVELSDYIIVHELCHRCEMNHSSRFWALVQEVIPNYKQLRQKLKEMQLLVE